MWTQIAATITQATEIPFKIETTNSVGGGCINQGYKISDGNRYYFVKLNQPNLLDMFAAEALALKQMYATQTITATGDPRVWQGDNVVHGQKITVYLKEERTVVEGRPDSRASATIYPDSDTKLP